MAVLKFYALSACMGILCEQRLQPYTAVRMPGTRCCTETSGVQAVVALALVLQAAADHPCMCAHPPTCIGINRGVSPVRIRSRGVSDPDRWPMCNADQRTTKSEEGIVMFRIDAVWKITVAQMHGCVERCTCWLRSGTCWTAQV